MVGTAVGAAVVIAICCMAGCTGSSSPVTNPGGPASTVSSPDGLAPGTTVFDCSNPIETRTSPTDSRRNLLDAVVVDVDTTSTVQVGVDPTAPHRLVAKVGLLVHEGREATLTIPGDWASKVSIAWGNHAAEWTTSLHIPACPQPWRGADQWLVYPGRVSLDAAACVPLEVRAGTTTATVNIPVGVRCPA